MRSGSEDNKRPSPPSSASVPDRQPDSDDQSCDNDADPASQTAKRKRPISVSYVKCDRGQPSCGWCKRHGQKCEYKERKPPGLRAGFGRFLEDRSREMELRLDKMEEILRKHSELLQTSPLPSLRQESSESGAQIGRQNPASDHDAQSDTSNALASSKLYKASHMSNNLFYSPHPNNGPSASASAEQAHAEYHVRTPLPGGSISAPVPDLPAQPGIGLSAVTPTPGAALPSSDADDLPPYNLVFNLVDLYFKHINTWCPILHRRTTLDCLFGISDLQEADRVLLHAIVATTMRFSSDPRLTDERRQHYHRVSKRKVLLYGMENSSVKSLLALLILALDICGSSNGPPGWNVMALITRSVVQLGLAVETNSFSVAPHYTSIYTLRAMILPEPKDFIEEESRRRLFWMIYLLDRYATIATAFEFALADAEIDRMLPCRDDLWMENQKVETRRFATSAQNYDEAHQHPLGRPENLGAFAYYIEILGILSKIHKFLKQPVDIGRLTDVEKWQLRYKELDKELTSWNFALPGEFGNMGKVFQPGSRNLNCNWVMLHATYHTAVIRLHSSAAYPTTRSAIFTPSFSAVQRCHSAVENISALGDFVVNNGFLPKLGPPFAFTIWVAARVLLVHGSTVEHKLSPQIPFFVDILREMGRYWPVAAGYSRLLQRVLDEHRDSERQGGGVTPSSVKILADMRRTAFDLDFLISRQPRHGPQSIGHLGSITPAKTPAPNELEYLDVFNFFNVPRLPFSGDHISGATEGPMSSSDMPAANASLDHPQYQPNEFNITNFMIDANSDWLFKTEGPNF
ncbi:n-terminal binuclear zn cluster-containing dna binding domain-containing [Trichoderma cornu-damae]|uniref:N-terminal binuclear zn cluster-containing dna binding domain-containing n=1 Tax=Trichoderma cornu-damae TaxID=654480 RepID=A0A9P8QX63_9HYPO|nr:n-terminal binuclear zn cluster-containing dna binding domain-containing [Trichoderma cornu-damae]